MKIEQPSIEKEQAQEEIKKVLEQALKEGLRVDLIINNLNGNPDNVPDLIVEEIQGDNLMMTYLTEDGDVGESIPLDLKRIKNAKLRVATSSKQ
ncbi:hypothetical protein JW977_01880 [Candidatus Falkowbacteria bacterium]|nr:hypothetical protein [Candidatus Falkowbacteria bacterium]